MRSIALCIIDHEGELTELDRVIGDGDHGINMRRGFEAVLKQLDQSPNVALPELMKGVGTALVMSVGGASGPLYGTIFLALGRELPEQPSREDWVRALGAALAAVKARGKSHAGQKTMVDVLAPAYDAFVEGADPGRAALAASEATIPMMAEKGRASFLGSRSVGHMDPGARSSALMIGAVVSAIGSHA